MYIANELQKFEQPLNQPSSTLSQCINPQETLCYLPQASFERNMVLHCKTPDLVPKKMNDAKMRFIPD